jgi:hypothetical protein
VTKAPQYNSLSFLVTLVVSVTAAGCAMTFDTTSLGVPAGMASPAMQPAVGDTFKVQSRALFLFWGLYPSSEPSLERALAGQLVGGSAVQNLRIRVYRRWADILITVLSAGIVDPVSVSFEGIVAPSAP